jgi:hypothetical protein
VTVRLRTAICSSLNQSALSPRKIIGVKEPAFEDKSASLTHFALLVALKAKHPEANFKEREKQAEARRRNGPEKNVLISETMFVSGWPSNIRMLLDFLKKKFKIFWGHFLKSQCKLRKQFLLRQFILENCCFPPPQKKLKTCRD